MTAGFGFAACVTVAFFTGATTSGFPAAVALLCVFSFEAAVRAASVELDVEDAEESVAALPAVNIHAPIASAASTPMRATMRMGALTCMLT